MSRKHKDIPFQQEQHDLKKWCNGLGLGRYFNKLTSKDVGIHSVKELRALSYEKQEEICKILDLKKKEKKKFVNALRRNLQQKCNSDFKESETEIMNDETAIDDNKTDSKQQLSNGKTGNTWSQHVENNFEQTNKNQNTTEDEMDKKEMEVSPGLIKWCAQQNLASGIAVSLTESGYTTVAHLDELSMNKTALNAFCEKLNVDELITNKFRKIMQGLRNPPPPQVTMTHKSVKSIVIGVTGAGKTSLVNLLYIWSKGITRIQEVDKVLIPTKYFPGEGKAHTEADAKCQSKSQTQGCSIYEFNLVYESTVYNLQFMDTPGLGDVEGIEKDDEHVQNILDTVAKTPELNSIVVMVNGSEPRVSTRLTYVMTKLIGMIPNICQQNLIVLLSNVNLRPNLEVQTLFNIKIPHQHIFFMNNEMFSIDPKTDSESTLEEVNFLYGSLKRKLKMFLETASNMKITDTSGFRKLKEQRDTFRNQLVLLQKTCNTLTSEKLRLTDLITDLTNMNSQKQKLDLNKYRKHKQEQSVQETTPYHNTICAVCDGNCHENCGLAETTVKGSDVFKGCAAMSGETCNQCSHHYTVHVHMKVKWVKKEIEMNVIDQEQAKLIDNALTNIAAKEQALDSLKQKLTDYENTIASKQREIRDLIVQMRQICSDFNYAKEIDLSMKVLKERIEVEQTRKNNTVVGLINATFEYFKQLKAFVDTLEL